MKCFVAELTESKHINIPADRMELQDDTLRAYDGDKLVAIIDMGVVITAHISEKATVAPTSPAQQEEAPQSPNPTPAPNPPQEQSPEPAEAGYKGFLYIKCEQCGSTKGFCIKTPIRLHRCSCGHTTALRDLKTMYVNCKCGASFKYRTNIADRTTSMNCLRCEAPVDLEYHAKKGVYETIE